MKNQTVQLFQSNYETPRFEKKQWIIYRGHKGDNKNLKSTKRVFLK